MSLTVVSSSNYGSTEVVLLTLVVKQPGWQYNYYTIITAGVK